MGLQRVTTWNLIISASEAEMTAEPFDTSVEDLATLIDMTVLYDEFFVLSRTDNVDHLNAPRSDLFHLLKDEGVIRAKRLSDQLAARVATSARMHLGTYLGPNRIDQFEEVLRYSLAPDEAEYGLLAHPDHVETLSLGDEWLRTLPDNADPLDALRREQNASRGVTFLIRTFLYAAYADVRAVPFIPDAARQAIVNDIIERERAFFREQLAKQLAASFRDYPRTLSGEDRQVKSPFAALVFSRCGGARRRIADETRKLRAELTPTRKRLRELETKATSGSRSDEISAEAEWVGILQEVATSFGPYPGLFDMKRLLSLSTEAADIASNPTSLKAWLSAVAGLPLEIAKRLHARRAIAEIHRLRDALPGNYELRTAIQSLFGRIRTAAQSSN